MATKAKSTTTKSKTKRPTEKAKVVKTDAKVQAARTAAASVTPKRFAKDLVLGSLVAELVGTFILAATVVGVATLSNGANPLFTGLAIVGIYLAFVRLSGAHLNPAVTIGMLTMRKITVLRAVGYIVAQFLGAMLAYTVISQFIHAYPVDAATGQAAPVLYHVNLIANDHWRPFMAEALGALILGFGIAAGYTGRKSSGEASALLGTMFFVGLMLALLGSASVLNPAVALTVGAYQLDNMWSLLQYAVGPIVGVVAAMWLYKFMDWDISGKSES